MVFNRNKYLGDKSVDRYGLTVDKILSFTLYHRKCPSCNFNNQFENMEVCPFCGQNLVLMKEENDEAVN